ncbi:transcriptional regulator [Virgisporangium aliadipatigenens]|uniref:Transcriptional regulator n=1 Tax=Virgisporangium aliadipatigenens TaxID=741659 RepID=A0A8J4DSS0_9ACTN|nr:helix-turn-helix transcriptional regulator [Virgisporangium aliadipatigenens]GIJ47517.1 transcriptional regulator [Virgisporangium aliadipatigenens]
MLERHAFGSLLRAWRDRATPQSIGLRSAGVRRVPGLRREELARLAGVSPDYIRRLEQGTGTPSIAVVEALARALRLTRSDYEYFCVIAGHAPVGDDRVPSHVGPSAQRLLDRLGHVPVCLCDAAWTALAWNPAWEAMNCDAVSARGRDRNVAWRTFTRPALRVRRSDERTSRFEATIAADLRTTLHRYPADPDLVALVNDLRLHSRRFDELWTGGGAVRFFDDQVLINHPDVGNLQVDCDILTVHEGDLRALVFSTEPGSDDARRLADTRSRHEWK